MCNNSDEDKKEYSLVLDQLAQLLDPDYDE